MTLSPYTPLAAAILVFAGPTESPADGLLAALRDRLTENYYAAPGVDLTRIMDDAARDLEAACAGGAEPCPLETGLEVARAAVARLQDRHTVILRAPAVPATQGAVSGAAGAGGAGATGGRPAGPPVQRLPGGWLTRTVRGQDYIYVAWVDPDGPAGRVGIRRFDRIIPPEGTTAAMLNALGGPVAVAVERPGERFEVRVAPESGRGGAMPLLSMAGDTAILQFPSGASEGAAQAGHDLLAQAMSAGARGVVLDLRDNGGGGLQCAAMTGGFTDYDAFMRDRRGAATRMSVQSGGVEMAAEGEGLQPVLTLERPARFTGPLAVLVNDGTASCAESMAIQITRAGRGFAVGEETYGVGNNTVRPHPLTDGWAIQLTTAYTEDGSGARLPSRPPLELHVEDDPIAVGRTGRDAVLEAALSRLAPAS